MTATGAGSRAQHASTRTARTAQPPDCLTGAEITTSVHWVRGVAKDRAWEEVVACVAGTLGESVVGLDRGMYGYSEGYLIGPVRVYSHPERSDMGVCVEMNGTACEELGGSMLAGLVGALDLRISRVDVALDGAAFTPGDIRDAWVADQVRTRCKVPEDAREDRQWRRCDWTSRTTGDKFTMGSRTSTQYARVYDDRGFTRFELEMKHQLAEKVGGGLIAALLEPERFRSLAVGLVRRFVDFVDPATDTNRARCTLLPWWNDFIDGAEKSAVTLEGSPVRTPDEIDAWVEHQVAPALALVERVYGSDRVAQLVRNGRQRWTGRHKASMRLGSSRAVPVAA